jgi:hypothetical protein
MHTPLPVTKYLLVRRPHRDTLRGNFRQPCSCLRRNNSDQYFHLHPQGRGRSSVFSNPMCMHDMTPDSNLQDNSSQLDRTPSGSALRYARSRSLILRWSQLRATRQGNTGLYIVPFLPAVVPSESMLAPVGKIRVPIPSACTQ